VDAEPDAELDAEVDAEPDAELDAEPDAEPDAEVDAAPDAEVDAAPEGDLGADEVVPDGGIGERVQPLCEDVDLETPRVLYLSADDSNSMASPVIVRRLIEEGATTVPAHYVRTYEFLNYAQFDFGRPEPGDLAVYGQLGGCDAGELALQIAVVSPPLHKARPPMHVVLVLDTSGSMAGAPIANLLSSVRAIAHSLRRGDRVSAVTWSVRQTPWLDGFAVQGPDDPDLLEMTHQMGASGGTDLNGGLRAGYALADAHMERGMLTRLVLISDGRANLGITDEQMIGRRAEDSDAEGIYLVGVGVGDGFNDTLMDVVTDAGRGAYVFVHNAAEARHVFEARFNETMLVAARNVRVALTLPPYFNIKKFFGEEYSPDPEKVRPQHLAPGDAMVFQQIIRACDPQMVRAGHQVMVRVTWQDPVTGADRLVVWRRTLGSLTTHHPNLHKAAAIVGFAEALKLSEGMDAPRLLALYNEALDTLQEADPGGWDADLNQIRRMLVQLIENVGARMR
jgi:Ca-activated chloride channel family protein